MTRSSSDPLIFSAKLTDEVRLLNFKSLYEANEAFVRKTLYWLVGTPHLDDLTQEVFVRLWKKQNQFRGDSAVRTWIYRITVNLAYEFLRKQKREAHKQESERAEPVERALMPSPESETVNKDLIQKGIARIPEKARSAFVLFYMQDLSIEEISTALRIPPGTVKSRLHQGRSTFMLFLDENGVQYEKS